MREQYQGVVFREGLYVRALVQERPDLEGKSLRQPRREISRQDFPGMDVAKRWWPYNLLLAS
jgi:hypothetical protein